MAAAIRAAPCRCFLPWLPASDFIEAAGLPLARNAMDRSAVRLNVMPSPQAEHCRQKATECEEEAKRAPSSSMAGAWLQLAKQWVDLAEGIERTNR